MEADKADLQSQLGAAQAPGAAPKAGEIKRLQKKIDSLDQQIAAVEKAGRDAHALEIIDDLLKRNRRDFPDLENEPQVTTALAAINSALAGRVKRTDANLPPTIAREVDEEPSLYVVHAVKASTAAAAPNPVSGPK